MRIVESTKLDFSDVLISPKRSQLTSRKDARLTREFKFKHSKHQWSGVPIIASNMDHTGTYKVNVVLTARVTEQFDCPGGEWSELFVP